MLNQFGTIMIYSFFLIFFCEIFDNVITFDDLDGFSDNVKGSLKFITGADQAYQEQGDVTK